MVHWLIDGMNVIGTQPNGWWKDRLGAMEDLVFELETYVSKTDEEMTIVFDARPVEIVGAGDRLEVLFAPGGPNAADDLIVGIVAGDADPGRLVVVTSDKDLLARSRSLGATSESAGSFLRRLSIR